MMDFIVRGGMQKEYFTIKLHHDEQKCAVNCETNRLHLRSKNIDPYFPSDKYILIPKMQKQKVIIIDNYDSFTYNLRHLVEELTQESVTIVRNNDFDMGHIMGYDYLIISPGPGLPDEAGRTLDVIRTYGYMKKILGVCLGLQAIGVVYGGRLKNLPTVYHGIQSNISLTGAEDPLFQGVPPIFEAGRYHSWVLDRDYVPDTIQVTATDEGGNIMAIRHTEHLVYGVQFHPESIMTPQGKKIVGNFLEVACDT
jgi:anthranilate synthase component 2